MRAGEHHGVGAPPVGVDEAAGDFVFDGGIGNGLAGKFDLGKRRQI